MYMSASSPWYFIEAYYSFIIFVLSVMLSSILFFVFFCGWEIKIIIFMSSIRKSIEIFERVTIFCDLHTMYCSLILVGFIFIVNGYADSIEDRYYFNLILRVLWRYPILKQTLIHRCSKELDKCKNNKILRSYTNIIDDDDLQEILNNLIDCFINSEICFQNDNWQEWSEWSSCSVTCGIGRMIRKRSCKTNRQCLVDLFSIESTSCFMNFCLNNSEKHLKRVKDNISQQSIEKNFYIIFIFIFPLFFTILCLPLCLFYYIYEFDFKIHALLIYVLSQCNRIYEIKRRRRRINISR